MIQRKGRRRRERCVAWEGGGGEPGGDRCKEAGESGQCQPGGGEGEGGVRRCQEGGQEAEEGDERGWREDSRGEWREDSRGEWRKDRSSMPKGRRMGGVR